MENVMYMAVNTDHLGTCTANFKQMDYCVKLSETWRVLGALC